MKPAKVRIVTLGLFSRCLFRAALCGRARIFTLNFFLLSLSENFLFWTLFPFSSLRRKTDQKRKIVQARRLGENAAAKATTTTTTTGNQKRGSTEPEPTDDKRRIQPFEANTRDLQQRWEAVQSVVDDVDKVSEPRDDDGRGGEEYRRSVFWPSGVVYWAGFARIFYFKEHGEAEKMSVVRLGAE